jgi:CBS domain containing-hemolysin-like protein
VFDRVVDPFVERLTGRHISEDEGAALSEEVLRMANRLREGHPQGSPLSIIRAAADAVGTTAEEVMVPRSQIVAFDEQTPPSELLEKMLNERFSRVPIYRNSIDEVVGKVHLKDLIGIVRADASNLESIMRPVLRVPPRKPILRLLSEMQRAFIHLAVVKDEFSGTLGIVTQEDVLEELVGEIRDEFDREELLTVRRINDKQYHALGRVKVADFNRQTGWEVPAEPGDSLSGLVFNALGHPARAGEFVNLGGYKLTVLSISGTNIGEVAVRCPD